jgi:hypothetical protein
MKRIGNSAGCGDAKADCVRSSSFYVDGIAKPLSAACPPEIITASCIRCSFEVDAIGSVTIRCAVDRGDVIGDRLTAGVIIIRVYLAWNSSWGSKPLELLTKAESPERSPVTVLFAIVAEPVGAG